MEILSDDNYINVIIMRRVDKTFTYGSIELTK